MRFDEFREKVERIREICEKYEKDFCAEAWNPRTELEKKEYETLSKYDFAPLLGFICNRQGLKKVKRDCILNYAFKFPHWLLERIGSLEPDKILSEGVKSLVEEYFSNRCTKKDYIDKVSEDIANA